MKIRALIWLSFLTLALAAPVFAGSHKSMKHMGSHGKHGDKGKKGHHSISDKYFKKYKSFMRYKDELELNEQQVKALTDIKFAVKRVKVKEEANKELAALDMWEEMHKETPSLEKINEHIDIKMAAKTRMAKAFAKAIMDSKAVLSPEQMVKMKELWMKEKY